MIYDATRFRAYAQAIELAVRPGDVAVDLGCGPGAFAMLACRAGARRVYALESGEILDMARQIAAANGFADRIVFLAGDSRRLELPERARVMVSDIRGVLPFYDGAIVSVEDARRRFLTPDGIMIPQRDMLRAALVEAGSLYARLFEPWSRDVHSLDLSAGRELLLNSTYGTHFTCEQLLSESHVWCVLDYASGASGRAADSFTLRAKRSGTAHGLCLWFDTQLWGDAQFSSLPCSGKMVYGHLFLPWRAPVSLVAGQEVAVELRVDPVGEDYVWCWNTTVTPTGTQKPIGFVQSSFWGAELSPDRLRRRALDYVPLLTESGGADRWILQAMNGECTLEQIARAATERFPQEFRNLEEAVRRVSNLAERYGR